MRLYIIIKMILNIFILVRYKDWIKNIIIFFPFIFSDNIKNFSLLYDLFIVFFVFSILCSISYIINDIIDIESDKIHSYKKKIKPLTNGTISKNLAYILLISLLVLFSSMVYYFNLYFIHFIFYGILLALYNLIFKKIIILDVLLISIGYLIRLDLGSNVIETDTSINLFICIYSLVSFILFIKRYVEFSTQNKTRISLKFYNDKIFNFLIFFAATIFIISCLYFIVLQKIYLIIILPLLVFNLYKYYNLSIHKNLGEFPIDVVLKNKILLANTFIILFVILFLYFY